MKLKDWEAMSREEKEAFWGKATEEERRALVEEAIPMEDRPHFEIVFEKIEPIPKCEPSLIKLCDELKRELLDENDAIKTYADMATQFNQLSHPVKAAMLNLISGQETLHYYVLEAIIKDITRECGE